MTTTLENASGVRIGYRLHNSGMMLSSFPAITP